MVNPKKWKDINEKHGPSKTERILGNEFKKIGVKARSQYKVSNMHVDFAFPKSKIAIEIDGPHHREPEQIEADSRRDYILRKKGWEVKRYTAEEVYANPSLIAEKIREEVVGERLNESTRESSYAPHTPMRYTREELLEDYRKQEIKKPKSEGLKFISILFGLIGLVFFFLGLLGLMVLVFFFFSGDSNKDFDDTTKFYQTTVNLTINRRITHDDELKQFCHNEIGSNIKNYELYTFISIIRCNNGIDKDYYYDSRTHQRIFRNEILARDQYYLKNINRSSEPFVSSPDFLGKRFDFEYGI